MDAINFEAIYVKLLNIYPFNQKYLMFIRVYICNTSHYISYTHDTIANIKPVGFSLHTLRSTLKWYT